MRTFRLKKESTNLMPGALYVEEAGNNRYVRVEDKTFTKFPTPPGVSKTVTSRESIENNPEWYEEVFPMLPEYGTKEEVRRMKKALGGK